MFAYSQTRTAFAIAVVVAVRFTPVPAQQPACDHAAVALQVLDRETRARLRDASVVVSYREAKQERQLNVRTDSTGRAQFCIPGAQEIGLRVSYRQVQSPHTRIVLENRMTSHTTTLDVPNVQLQGIVLDFASGTPVANAAVRLAHSTLDVLTGADGVFYFPHVPIGDYDVRIEHPSYLSTSTRLIASSSDLRATFHVTPEPVPLPPVRVIAVSRQLDQVGFYLRERRGVGTFIGRSQIESARVQFASDLLRSVPGVRLVQATARRGAPRSFTNGRGTCRFRFVLDGTRVLPDFELDNIPAMQIEGIEVYSGLAQVPAEFRAHTADGAAGTCGVIAVWTKDGR